MKAKVMPDGRLSLPAELRKRHGLAQGGEVIVEDMGDAIVLRVVDQVVARVAVATYPTAFLRCAS
jgi:AbrB family looped-hinge helix DNA binding protein